MGLASFFVVRDVEGEAFAKELDLRLGETDIPLVFQDKRLTADGRRGYSPSKDDLLTGYLGWSVLADGAQGQPGPGQEPGRGCPRALGTDLGYKDTVLVWPGEQLFLFHCHNLEHEDQGMMLNVKVV